MEHKIAIDEKLYETYPEIRLGCVQFNVDVKPSNEQFWKEMEEIVLPEVRTQIEGKEWSEIPGVKGSRAAYKAFGRNPGRYRVSSEALLRRVRREDELYHINSVVDVNNLLSVKSGMSVGSYDIEKIKGAVCFRKAKEGEGYTGIGKSSIDMENMLVLVDEEGLFGSSMSDSQRAMVCEDAKKILVVFYCFEDSIDLEFWLSESVKAFELYAQATDVKTWII